MAKTPKRPRDTNQLAKMIVDLATGEAEEFKPKDDGKDPAAVALGRKGGKKGGKARAEKLTPEQRSEIARKAAKARWSKTSQ
ncbi:MAG: histone H1 [Pseudomonadota bacterium]